MGEELKTSEAKAKSACSSLDAARKEIAELLDKAKRSDEQTARLKEQLKADEAAHMEALEGMKASMQAQMKHFDEKAKSEAGNLAKLKNQLARANKGLKSSE